MRGLEVVPTDAVVLNLPFRGRALVQMSPADRIPSHGTHAFGTTFAIDFVPVDERGRSAPRSWRGHVGVEAPEVFVGFGVPVLAPIAGEVVAVHDAEVDHEGRRSQLTLIPYVLGQARRARAGWQALAGNHVVLRIDDQAAYLALAHLRRGSARVRVGERVKAGQVLAECGNSGNSTEPHLHLQVCASTDWETTRAIPLAFRRATGEPWIPRNGEIVASTDP